MKPARLVLALNCGSSSIKFALVDPETGQRAASALGERVGTADAEVTAQRNDLVSTTTPSDTSQRGVIEHLVSALSADERGRILGVGHRVVHGGSRFTEPTLVDDDVVAGIRDVAELAPLHVIGNLSGIEAIRDLLPEVANVAVFDTAFHRTLPEVAYRYAVPGAWFTDHGVRRYGFHGISHRFVSERAADLIGKPVADLRLVTLHLGNGCSAAAVTGGVSVDTTMGFTPMEGLVMGSRSGDIDPGVIAYMAQRLDSDAHAVIDELNHRSGLLGLSGLSRPPVLEEGPGRREARRWRWTGEPAAGYEGGEFLTASTVDVRQLDDTYWMTLQPLIYQGRTERSWSRRVTVLTSLRCLAHSRGFLPRYERYTKAAVLHDYLWSKAVPAGLRTRTGSSGGRCGS